MHIADVLHQLIDSQQGGGLDKEAAHAAVDEEYPEAVADEPVEAPASETSAEPEAPTV